MLQYLLFLAGYSPSVDSICWIRAFGRISIPTARSIQSARRDTLSILGLPRTTCFIPYGSWTGSYHVTQQNCRRAPEFSQLGYNSGKYQLLQVLYIVSTLQIQSLIIQVNSIDFRMVAGHYDLFSGSGGGKDLGVKSLDTRVVDKITREWVSQASRYWDGDVVMMVGIANCECGSSSTIRLWITCHLSSSTYQSLWLGLMFYDG